MEYFRPGRARATRALLKVATLTLHCEQSLTNHSAARPTSPYIPPLVVHHISQFHHTSLCLASAHSSSLLANLQCRVLVRMANLIHWIPINAICASIFSLNMRMSRLLQLANYNV